MQLTGVYTYLFPIIETDIKRDIYFQFIAPSWTIELFRRIIASPRLIRYLISIDRFMHNASPEPMK